MQAPTSEFKYVGSELDLFAAVHNWKTYWSRSLQPYIGGDVLEVGAGIGANTAFMDQGIAQSWVCLEPDSELADQLAANIAKSSTRSRYESVCGTLQSLPPCKFDTILYIDVLEHIQNDRTELETAAVRLKPGGRIIVLAPAHQSLYTPFDAAIGHYRRYNRPMLRAITPTTLQLERIWYLDSAGLLLSAGNRLFLRQSMPTKEQLSVWDNFVIPVSRLLDPCFFRSIGKSIVAVWQLSPAM